MPGLSPKTISLVQSSGTYLKEHHGNGLATAMYDIMLNGFPFVKDMCNQSHQIPDEFGTTDQVCKLATLVFNCPYLALVIGSQPRSLSLCLCRALGKSGSSD